MKVRLYFNFDIYLFLCFIIVIVIVISILHKSYYLDEMILKQKLQKKVCVTFIKNVKTWDYNQLFNK